MKKAVFVAFLLGSAFVAGGATSGEETALPPVVDAALAELPIVLRGIGDPDLDSLSSENYAVSDTLMVGGTGTLGEHARRVLGDTAIADEIASAATKRQDELLITKLPEMEIEKMRVLALADFENSRDGYQWEDLNEQFPAVRAVIRVSEPALDRSGTYAAVRYEVWTSNGREWVALQFFELRYDGWHATRLVMGINL